MSFKKTECEVIRDLLPLYIDGVVSEGSKKMIEEHLKECEDCRSVLESMKDDTIQEFVSEETENVLKRHRKRERTTAYKTGVIIAGILMIPIIIALICMTVTENTFGVANFMVLVSSMFLVAAMIVVPLLSTENKLSRSVLLSIIGIILIELFVDIGQGGGNFVTWVIPTIFGLSIPFFPVILRGFDLKGNLQNHKALITVSWDTVWLYLTVFAVSYGDKVGLKEGIIVSTVMLVFIWGIFLTARYLPGTKFRKASLISLISGIFIGFVNDITYYFLGQAQEIAIKNADFSVWDVPTTNANVSLIGFILGLVLMVVFFIIDIMKMKASKNK